MSDIRKIITTTLFNKLYHFLIIFIYDLSVMLTILKILERLTCNLSILKQIPLSFEYTSPREILHFHDRRPGALYILSSCLIYLILNGLVWGRNLLKKITGAMGLIDHTYLLPSPLSLLPVHLPSPFSLLPSHRCAADLCPEGHRSAGRAGLEDGPGRAGPEKTKNLEFNTRFEILSKYFHFRLYFSSSIIRLSNSGTGLVTYHKTHCRPFLQTIINSINNRLNPQNLEPKGTPFFNLRFYSNNSSSMAEKNFHNRSLKPNSFQLRPISGKAITDKRKKLFKLSRKKSTSLNKNLSLGLYPPYGSFIKKEKSYPEKPAGPARPKLPYSRTNTHSNLTSEFPEVGREDTNVGAGVELSGSIGTNRSTYLRGWIKDWIKKLRYLQIIGNYRLEENDKILLSILKERKLNLNKKMSPVANLSIPSTQPRPLKSPRYMQDLRGETHSSINLPNLGHTSVFLNGQLGGNSEALLSTTGFINSRIPDVYKNYKDLFLLGRQYIGYKFNSSKSTSTLTPKTNIITNNPKFLKSQAYSLPLRAKNFYEFKGQSLALLQPSYQTGTKPHFITGHADSINRSLELTNKEMLSANTANLTKIAKALPSSTTKNSSFSPLRASKQKNDLYTLALNPISPFITLDMENETQMANLSLSNHDESKLSDNTYYIKRKSLAGQNKINNKKSIPYLRPFNNLRYKEIAPSKLFKLTNPLGQTDTSPLINMSQLLGPEYLLGETNINFNIADKLATSLEIDQLKYPLGSSLPLWTDGHKVTWAGDKLVIKKYKQETRLCACFYDYRLRPLNSLLTLLNQKGPNDWLFFRGIAFPNSNSYIVGKSVPENMAPQTLSLIASKALLNTYKFPEGLLIKGSALDKLRKLNLFLVSRVNVDSSLNMTPFYLSRPNHLSLFAREKGPDWKALCVNTPLVMPLISNKIKNLMSSFLSYKDTNSLAGPYYSHLNLSQIKAKLLMTSFNSLLPSPLAIRHTKENSQGQPQGHRCNSPSLLPSPASKVIWAGPGSLFPSHLCAADLCPEGPRSAGWRAIEKEVYFNNRAHHDKLSRAMGKPNILTFSYDWNDKLNNKLVSKNDMRRNLLFSLGPEQGLGSFTSTNKEDIIETSIGAKAVNRSSLVPVDVSWEGEMMYLKKLLNYFFKKMHCLISLPVLEYLPDKLNIRLFYYLKKNAKTYYSASNAINTNMRNLFRNSKSYSNKATYSDKKSNALLFFHNHKDNHNHIGAGAGAGDKLTGAKAGNNNQDKLGSIIRPDLYIDHHLDLGDNLPALPFLPARTPIGLISGTYVGREKGTVLASNGKNPDLESSKEETKLVTLRLRQLKDRAINIIRLKKYWEIVFNNVPNIHHGVLRRSSLTYTMASQNTTKFSPTTPRPRQSGKILRLHLFSKWRGSNLLSPKSALLKSSALNLGKSPLSLPQMNAESFLFSGKIPLLKGIIESKLQIYPYSFSPSYGSFIKKDKSYPQLSSGYQQLRENNNRDSSIKPWQSIGPVQLNNLKRDLTKNGLYFQNSILKTVLLRNIAKLNLVLYLSKWKELSPSIIKTKMNVSENIASPFLPRTEGIGRRSLKEENLRDTDKLLYADMNFSLGSSVTKLHVKNNEALCKKEELSEKEEISGLEKDNNQRTIQALINLEDAVRKDTEAYPYDNINSTYSTSGGIDIPLAVEAPNTIENLSLDQRPLGNSSRKDLSGNSLNSLQSLTGAQVPFLRPGAPPFSLRCRAREKEKEIDANLLDSRLPLNKKKDNGSLVILKINGPKLRCVVKILDKESLVTGAFLNTPVKNIKGELRRPNLSPIGLWLQEKERDIAIGRYRYSVSNSSRYIDVMDLNSTKLNDVIPYENINDKLLPGILLDKPCQNVLSVTRGMRNFLLSLMPDIRYFIQASSLITGSGWLGHRDLLRLISKNKDRKKLAENIKIINYETLHNIDPIKILDVLELIDNIREKRQQTRTGTCVSVNRENTSGSIKKELSPKCHRPRENTSSLFQFQSTLNKTKTLANNKPMGNILYLKTRKGKNAILRSHDYKYNAQTGPDKGKYLEAIIRDNSKRKGLLSTAKMSLAKLLSYYNISTFPGGIIRFDSSLITNKLLPILLPVWPILPLPAYIPLWYFEKGRETRTYVKVIGQDKEDIIIRKKEDYLSYYEESPFFPPRPYGIGQAVNSPSPVKRFLDNSAKGLMFLPPFSIYTRERHRGILNLKVETSTGALTPLEQKINNLSSIMSTEKPENFKLFLDSYQPKIECPRPSTKGKGALAKMRAPMVNVLNLLQNKLWGELASYGEEQKELLLNYLISSLPLSIKNTSVINNNEWFYFDLPKGKLGLRAEKELDLDLRRKLMSNQYSLDFSYFPLLDILYRRESDNKALIKNLHLLSGSLSILIDSPFQYDKAFKGFLPLTSDLRPDLTTTANATATSTAIVTEQARPLTINDVAPGPFPLMGRINKNRDRAREINKNILSYYANKSSEYSDLLVLLNLGHKINLNRFNLEFDKCMDISRKSLLSLIGKKIKHLIYKAQLIDRDLLSQDLDLNVKTKAKTQTNTNTNTKSNTNTNTNAKGWVQVMGALWPKKEKVKGKIILDNCSKLEDLKDTNLDNNTLSEIKAKYNKDLSSEVIVNESIQEIHLTGGKAGKNINLKEISNGVREPIKTELYKDPVLDTKSELKLKRSIDIPRALDIDRNMEIDRPSPRPIDLSLPSFPLSLLPSNKSRDKKICIGPFSFREEKEIERDRYRETQNLELFYKRHIEEIKKLHQELYRTNDFLGALGSVGPYTLIKPLPFREINRRSKGIVAYNKNIFNKLLVFLKVILNKEIELDITRIKNPFNETHILTQILGELTKNNSSKFYRLSKKIIDNAILNPRLTNAGPALREGGSISHTDHSSINSYKGYGNNEQILIPAREISLLDKILSNVNFGSSSNFNNNLSLRLGHFRSLDKWSSLSSLNKEIKINKFLAYPGRQKKLPNSNLTLRSVVNKSITALRSNQNLLWEARDISRYVLNMDNQTGELKTKLPVPLPSHICAASLCPEGHRFAGCENRQGHKSRELYINPTHNTHSLLTKDGYGQSPILAYANNNLSLPLNSRDYLSMKPKVDSSNLIEPNTNKSWRKLSLVESSLSGIKLKLSGRLERTAIIPRRTNQELLIGNMSRGSTSFKNDSRLTYKNKRGAYSITVSTSQIINSRPGHANISAINNPATDIERQFIRSYPNNIQGLAKTHVPMDLGRNNNNILSRINRKFQLRDSKFLGR